MQMQGWCRMWCKHANMLNFEVLRCFWPLGIEKIVEYCPFTCSIHWFHVHMSFFRVFFYFVAISLTSHALSPESLGLTPKLCGHWTRRPCDSNVTSMDSWLKRQTFLTLRLEPHHALDLWPRAIFNEENSHTFVTLTRWHTRQHVLEQNRLRRNGSYQSPPLSRFSEALAQWRIPFSVQLPGPPKIQVWSNSIWSHYLN